LSEETSRAEIVVKGKVQRVNFRNFAKEIAKKHHLLGTARNVSNYDEDVAVICEGPKRIIERYILDLKKSARSPIRIDELQVHYTTPKGEFEDFNFERSTDLTKALGERLDCLLEFMKVINTRLEELNQKVDALQFKRAQRSDKKKRSRRRN
jgi:acylphosphatase